MAEATDDARPGSIVHAPEREGRQVALAAVFEAEFGQRTATDALARRRSEGDIGERAGAHAARIVEAVVTHRVTIDERIEEVAPTYPVVQLARIDRALLRCGVGELLHCPTTPARVAISEWVELARTYSGEPTRRLMNGALGRVAREAAADGTERDEPSPRGPESATDRVTQAHREGPAE
ncbi:MAG: transcription antitermination factor NusB [Candidatus Limnocylindrales bacterium]